MFYYPKRNTVDSSANLNEKVLNSLDSGIVVLGSDYQVEFYNPAAISMLKLGNKRKQASSAILEKLHLDNGQLLRIKKTIAKASSWSGTLQLSESYLDLKILPLPGMKVLSKKSFMDCQLLIAIDDKTALMNQIQKHARTVQPDEKAEKIKSEFFSQISHEFRTPLNAIIGFSEFLLDNDEINEEQSDCLQEIHNSGKYLLESINDIIGKARNDDQKIRIHRENIAAREFLEECVDQIRPLTVVKNMTLQVNSEVDSIFVDRIRLRQVLVNLLRNAVIHNHAGGEICIKLRAEEDFIQFEVIDNGIGIAPVQQADILSPFKIPDQQGETKRRGLGLVISKQLTRLMGGSMGLISQQNFGSLFWLRLPCKSAQLNSEQALTEKSRITVCWIEKSTESLPHFINMSEYRKQIDFISYLKTDAIEFNRLNFPLVIILRLKPHDDAYDQYSRLCASIEGITANNKSYLKNLVILVVDSLGMVCDIYDGTDTVDSGIKEKFFGMPELIQVIDSMDPKFDD